MGLDLLRIGIQKDSDILKNPCFRKKKKKLLPSLIHLHTRNQCEIVESKSQLIETINLCARQLFSLANLVDMETKGKLELKFGECIIGLKLFSIYHFVGK